MSTYHGAGFHVLLSSWNKTGEERALGKQLAAVNMHFFFRRGLSFGSGLLIMVEDKLLNLII